MAEAEKKPSKVEHIKEESVYLKGNLAEEIADPSISHISADNEQLIKHHGSYQQYDRDTATERKKAGLDKEWSFMVRVKLPAGRLTADQYLAMEKIAKDYANNTLRITTRQTFQFHVIPKGDMKSLIAGVNHALATTFGGCGDVVRNVICSPAPIKDHIHEQLVKDSNLISDHTLPKTTSYHEIWLDGENVARSADNEELEPLYGKHYLPRKFKIALATPEDNSADLFTHDLAIFLVYENDELQGYNLCLGGGLGMNHNKPATYPRLATPIAFVKPEDLIRGVEAVIKLQRDNGDRSNRKHARLKYVVEEKGIEWTKKTLEEYFGESMEDARPMPPIQIPDHMGWHEQGDGKWYLGIPVSSGRIKDDETTQIHSALNDIITEYQMDLSLTPDQNIILCDIEEGDKQAIEDKLKSYGIKLREDLTDVDRYSIACVSYPTCGLALAEAERVRDPLIAEFEKAMEGRGILEERISVRITGCPNGCGRPYVGDIGIVGRTPGTYALYVGGDFEGTRLNEKFADKVPYEQVVPVYDSLFAEFVANRQGAETFGDYTNRIGVEQVQSIMRAQFPDEKWANS